jgi:hypothetical protein
MMNEGLLSISFGRFNEDQVANLKEAQHQKQSH